ncbi:hypothetical protein DFP73DRAFT_131766 [Morchella snyderi]|nr:hypothetical protein DFP73DRAFT_131766 [Morchella snyderi]
MECAHEIGYISAPWLGPKPSNSEGPGKTDQLPEEIYEARLKELDSLYEGKDPVLDRASNYQYCMTLGQLKAVLGASMDASKLVEELVEKNGTKRLVVSSKNLPEIFAGWASTIMGLGEPERGIRLKTAAVTARHTRTFLKRYLVNGDTNVFIHPASKLGEFEGIIAVIAMIAESIEIMQSQYRTGKLATGVKPFKSRFVLETCTAYKKEMIEKGWCPFVLRKLESMTAVVYARDYKPVPSLSGHQHCTELRCDGNKVIDKSPEHYPRDCCCENVKPPFEEVLQSLDMKTGSIPVLKLDSAADNGNQSRLRVGEITKNSKEIYVAVSHVWSDGLRGSTKEGLPTCQLERIDRMVREIAPDGKGAFWVDTICIPEEKREEGIRLMGRTYKGAAKVLVIDAGIRGLSTKASHEEKLLRILTSVWMQRLWTLQEAVYAKEMVFEFRDGLVRASEMLSGKMTSLQGHLAIDMYQLTMRTPGHNPYSNIWDISRALSTRTAGRVDDETLGVVDLIHDAQIDSFKLANIICPDSEIPAGTPERQARGIRSAWAAKRRMKAFLTNIPKLPRNTPFLIGSKLQDPGFHWAPESFMTTQGVMENIVPMRDYATATDDGLKCNLMCFEFEKTTIKTSEPSGDEKKKRWLFQAKDANGEYVFYEMLIKTSDAPFSCNTFIIPYTLNPGDRAYCIVGMLERCTGKENACEDGTTRYNCRYEGLITLLALRKPSTDGLIEAAGAKLNLCLT